MRYKKKNKAKKLPIIWNIVTPADFPDNFLIFFSSEKSKNPAIFELIN